MSAIVTNRPAPRPAGPIARLVATILDWNDARATRHALRKLSRHELNDIGLLRSDIDRIARRG